MHGLELKYPLVSVVMPTYNHAKFIGVSIESVMNQTYGNLELLIIDNYSNDNTRDIVSTYSNKDKRIKYILYNNNGLIANSRNLGIEVSEGEYIAFLDSDDLWLASKIEMQIPLFVDPDVGLVYCNIDEIDKDGLLINVTRKSENRYREYVLPELLTGKLSIACSSVVIRKKCLNKFKSPFMLNRQGAEDCDLWLRMAENVKFSRVDKSLVYYRVHVDATSRDYNMMFKSTMITLDDFRERISRTGCGDAIYDKNVLLRSCACANVNCLEKYAHYLLGDKRYRDLVTTIFEMLKFNVCSRQAWMMFLRLIIYPIWRCICCSRKKTMDSSLHVPFPS